jgi:hypothetical protein
MEGYPDIFISGGIDWFEWSGLIDFTQSPTFESIANEFQRAKESCQTFKLPYLEVHIPHFGPVRVSRHGLNRGGERGQHFEFRIYVAGGMYALSPRTGEGLRAGKKRQQANFYVLQTGRDCLLVGARQGHQRALEFLAALGGVPVQFKMTRGDLCLDISNLHVEVLNELVASRQFVTLARHVHPNVNFVSEEVSGFTAGKSPIRLTAYDKRLEQMGKSDQLYLRALIDRRWYGSAPKAATRIEYQMLRRWLLEQGISTPEDFLNRCGSLCEKLTFDWFRLAAQPVDRKNKHQDRSEIHPIWRGIQVGFATVFGQPEGPLVPVRRDKILPMELAKQGRGCLANGLLQMAMPFETYGEFSEMCRRLLLAIPSSDSEAADFMDELQRRKMEYETS